MKTTFKSNHTKQSDVIHKTNKTENKGSKPEKGNDLIPEEWKVDNGGRERRMGYKLNQVL